MNMYDIDAVHDSGFQSMTLLLTQSMKLDRSKVHSEWKLGI